MLSVIVSPFIGSTSSLILFIFSPLSLVTFCRMPDSNLGGCLIDFPGGSRTNKTACEIKLMITFIEEAAAFNRHKGVVETRSSLEQKGQKKMISH